MLQKNIKVMKSCKFFRSMIKQQMMSLVLKINKYKIFVDFFLNYKLTKIFFIIRLRALEGGTIFFWINFGSYLKS